MSESPNRVSLPLLFLSGTRDELADLALLRLVCEGLGERATLHLLETADHSFKVQKRARPSEEDVLSKWRGSSRSGRLRH